MSSDPSLPPPMPPTPPSALRQPALLPHQVSGDGPPLVLLNGGMMTAASWEPVARRLRPSFRLLQLDFRGQLLAPGPPHGTLDDHAADVLALLDHLGWPAAHVVGTSFGAEVAIVLAAAAPHRVRSLVLATAIDRETDAFRADRERMQGLLAAVLAAAEVGDDERDRAAGPTDRERFWDTLVDGVYSARYRATAATELAARRDRLGALPLSWFAGVSGLLATLAGFDLTPALARIPCPALVVLAGDDRVMDRDRSYELATALGAELAVHPTAGHALVAEDPDWLAEVTLEFLGRQEEGTRS